MVRKTLGFVPLIWECPYCNTQNPGPIKSCTSCGAPQPADVEFLQVDDEKFEFIKDEALIRMAKAGPDIHCPYCGTRNPADAELCSHCGGEINIKGKVVRETGGKVRKASQAKQEGPTAAPAPKKKPNRKVTMLGGLAALAVIAGIIIVLMMLLKTDAVEGTVINGSWERNIAIETFTTITNNDWWDEIPEGAEIQSCEQRYRYTSEDPEPNATEVCDEATVEDTGTGVGEVVQECVYEVYDDYCEYTYMDWAVLNSVEEAGDNWSPVWPEPNLTADQRLGEKTEKYTIVFSGDGENFTYTTSDLETYMLAQPGTNWQLNVNQFGGVQSIEYSN